MRRLDIQVLHVERVFFDELSAGFDVFTHEPLSIVGSARGWDPAATAKLHLQLPDPALRF